MVPPETAEVHELDPRKYALPALEGRAAERQQDPHDLGAGEALRSKVWMLVGTHEEDTTVRAEPFDAVALELEALWI